MEFIEYLGKEEILEKFKETTFLIYSPWPDINSSQKFYVTEFRLSDQEKRLIEGPNQQEIVERIYALLSLIHGRKYQKIAEEYIDIFSSSPSDPPFLRMAAEKEGIEWRNRAKVVSFELPCGERGILPGGKCELNLNELPSLGNAGLLLVTTILGAIYPDLNSANVIDYLSAVARVIIESLEEE